MDTESILYQTISWKIKSVTLKAKWEALYLTPHKQCSEGFLGLKKMGGTLFLIQKKEEVSSLSKKTHVPLLMVSQRTQSICLTRSNRMFILEIAHSYTNYFIIKSGLLINYIFLSYWSFNIITTLSYGQNWNKNNHKILIIEANFTAYRSQNFLESRMPLIHLRLPRK